MQEINEELENDRSVLEWMLGQYVTLRSEGRDTIHCHEVEATTKAQPESL